MGDLIERRAAIDAIKTWGLLDGLSEGQAIEILADEEKLPSAQPKAIRPKFVAEDRYIKNHFSTYPHCPKCNYELETGDCYCKVCGCHIDWSEDDERFDKYPKREKSMDEPYEDYCYECGGYGDNYYIDDDGELKCRCPECSYNDWEDDDEDW